MSLGIQLRGLGPVFMMLKWLTQPQFAYEWQSEDRFFVCPIEVKNGRQRRTEYEILIWLPEVDAEDRRFLRVFALLDDKQKKRFDALPPHCTSCEEFPFPEFLQAIQLTPQRPRKRKLRQNLLVAVYGGSHDALSEVFGSAPKNPNQTTSILFLDERDSLSPDLPRYLIRLPQADPQFPWAIWLETENRRLRDAQASVKLFRHLGDGVNNEFYVEYGWTHPAPEVVDFFPSESGANPILIEGQQDGKPNTRWIPIVAHPADSQVEFQPWDESVPAVDMRLEREPALVLNYRPRPGHRLRMTPRLEELSRERREGLHAVEARIRAAQKQLFQLEQQRSALTAEQQSRFRLLLVFDQPRAAAGQTPALAPDFQRFLLMSRRQFDKFDYLFVETEHGPDHHIVVTREPMFWQDLHSALATEVYYQPLPWANWATRHVFVKHGFLLTPAIDDQSLAEGLERLIAQRGGADKLVLIGPGESQDQTFHLRVLPQATDGGLASQLSFINRDYPVAELRARGEVRKELLAALQKCQVDLVAEVHKLEDNLRRQAALRLERLHSEWNTIAPKVDSAVRHLEHCRDKYEDFSNFLGRFSGTWRQFIDRTLAFQNALIREKLDVLKRLEFAENEWHKTLDETKKANQTTAEILPPLEEKIKKALAEAEVLYKRADDAFKLFQFQAEVAERELSDLCARVALMEKVAQQMHERVEMKEKEYEDRNARLKKLRTALLDFHARLVKHRADFQAQLDQLEQELAKVQRDLAALAQALATAEKRKKDWNKAIAEGAEKLKEVEVAHDTAKAEIDALDKQQKAQVRKADRLVQSVEEALENIRLRQDATRAERERVQRAIKKLSDEIARLESEQKGLVEDQKLLETKKNSRNEQIEIIRAIAKRIDDVIKSVDASRVADLARLAQDWKDTSNKLALLSELEITLQPLDSFRDAIELRQGSTDIYHRFRSLAGAQDGAEFWARLTESDLGNS